MTTKIAGSMVENDVNVKLSGDVVQVVSTQTGVLATGTGTIPADDTIPEITEGTEFMTRAITPTSASSVLLITVSLSVSNSGIGHIVAALFQGATANALAAAAQLPTSAGNMVQLTFTHRMTAGTTSAMTFRVRAGGTAAGTTTLNGFGGNRFLGGVAASSITITEIQA